MSTNGFIFYKPPQEWEASVGFKNIFTEAFKQEYTRRVLLNNPKIEISKIENQFNIYNDVNSEFIYIDNKKIKRIKLFKLKSIADSQKEELSKTELLHFLGGITDSNTEYAKCENSCRNSCETCKKYQS